MPWATGNQATRFLQTNIEQQKAQAASTAAEARKTAADKTPSKAFTTALQAATTLGGVAKAGSDVYANFYQKPYWEQQAKNLKIRNAREKVKSYWDHLEEFFRGRKLAKEIMGEGASDTQLAMYLQHYTNEYLLKMDIQLRQHEAGQGQMSDDDYDHLMDVRSGIAMTSQMMNEESTQRASDWWKGVDGVDEDAIPAGATMFGPTTYLD